MPPPTISAQALRQFRLIVPGLTELDAASDLVDMVEEARNSNRIPRLLPDGTVRMRGGKPHRLSLFLRDGVLVSLTQIRTPAERLY